MALKAIVDSLDGIEESLKALYEEQNDGRFRLKVEGVEFPEDIAGLKSALEKEKRAAREAAAKLRDFDGIDPEEFQRLREEKEKSEQERLERRGEWDKLRAQMSEKHEAQLAKEREVAARYRAELEKRLIDAEATSVITSEDFQGSPKLLMPHVRKRIKVEEEGGEFRVLVLQADGQTPAVTSDGSPASIRDLIAEMRDDSEFSTAFKASGASGVGAPTNPAPGVKTPRGAKQVAWGDQGAFIDNLEAIAKGETRVVPR